MVDILSKLASTKKPRNNHIVLQETLSRRSIEVDEVNTIHNNINWMTLLLNFMQINDLLPDEMEAKKFR